MIFDFILTGFNEAVYILMPNILFYKLGDFSVSIGYFAVLYIIDKELLNFKMKRIPAILVLVLSVIQLIYPVITQADFEVVVLFGYIGVLFVLLIFLLFLYVGIKTPSLGKYAYMIALGILLIGVGSIIGSFAAMTELISLLYTMFFILLASGILLMGYGVLKFNV